MRKAVLICCLLGSGCVFTTEYPSTWPQPESVVVGNECPDISGRFENVGRSADDDSTTPRLTEYAFESDIMDVEYILISHPDAKTTVIEAEVTNESGQIRELRKDIDFTCSDGKLWLSGSYWDCCSGNALLYVARTKWRIGLTKTNDGSLVGDMHNGGVGLAMFLGIIPVPGAGTMSDFLLWSISE